MVAGEGSEEVAAAIEQALAASRFDLPGLAKRRPPTATSVPETLRCHEVQSGCAADTGAPSPSRPGNPNDEAHRRLGQLRHGG